MKGFNLRLDEETLNKLRTVAEYEGRSMHGQVLFLLRRCIEAFEQEHGKIRELEE